MKTICMTVFVFLPYFKNLLFLENTGQNYDYQTEILFTVQLTQPHLIYSGLIPPILVLFDQIMLHIQNY